MKEENSTAAERDYIAFISYRHKPLDLAIAKKLHRRIERYVIPKELRRQGQAAPDGEENTQGTNKDDRKLGLVFRDQDELPISNNLTENIRTALDHSEFLIVVCSPDTPESLWVQREISYFLEHHDRDHLLAILVSGDPEQSFPPQLTEVRDEDGNLVEKIEPLAANIVADSAFKRDRLFQTESLRILASLIGCPYDALYHREHRYQMRRIGIAVTAAAIVAAGFIGMLLNRNAMIRDQLRVSMINESKALAALSETAFRDGDYRGALENALNALPGRDPGRPYVAEAENALSEELYLYCDHQSMRYCQSFEQETEIKAVALSEDGSLFATGDSYGNVRVSDIGSGQLLWSTGTADSVWGLYFSGQRLLIDNLAGRCSVFSLEGELLRQTEHDYLLDVNTEKGMYLCYSMDEPGRPVWITDIRTGEVLYDLGTFDEPYYQLVKGTISKDGRYAAVLAKNAGDEDGADLYVYDLAGGQRKAIRKGFMYASLLASYALTFDEEDDLIISLCGGDNLLQDREEWEGNFVTLYARTSGWEERFTTYLDFGRSIRLSNGSLDLSDYIDFIGCIDGGIAIACQNRLIMVDSRTGNIRWQTDLPGRVCAANLYSSGTAIGLVLSDGTVTLCTTNNGILSSVFNRVSFDCEYDIYGGVISGDSLTGDRYVVIPYYARNRAAVISIWTNSNLQLPPWSAKIPQNARFFSSPAGTKLAAVSFDDAGASNIYYVDLAVNSLPVEYVSSDMTQSVFQYCHDRVVLTETGKLIMGDRIFDFGSEAGKCSEVRLTDSDTAPDWTNVRMSASCADPESGKVTTAALQKDPSDSGCSLLFREDGVLTDTSSAIPEEVLFEEYTSEDGIASGYSTPKYLCRDVNACGYTIVCGQYSIVADWKYAVYSAQEDKWTRMDYLGTSEDEILALAKNRPILAARDQDGHLGLFDLSSGEETVVLEDTLPSESVVKLLFAHGDEWVAAFTKSGTLAIYSAKDGRELHHSGHSVNNLRFYSRARYEVHLIPQTDRFLVLYDDTTYTASTAIVIDTGSMETTGFYNAVSCYFPPTDTVLIKHDTDSAYTCKLFSVEEMQQKAEELLQGK